MTLTRRADNGPDAALGTAAPRVQQVPAAVTRPLRQRLLKQNSTLDDLAQSDGDFPTAGYYAALDSNGQVLAVASARPEAPPWPCEAKRPWRIRGVVTVPGRRSDGLGTAVVRAVLDHISAHGGDLAWLNGRTPARHFYEQLGFSQRGDDWMDPESGPHMTMFKHLHPAPYTSITPR
jgi:GNAT superfamily N-acetyltransferase